jgi:predicted enzyme related to lactoylglutathione lyase
MPTITRHMYVIAVPDLARSGAFYRDVLGFAVHELGDPGWRLFEKDHSYYAYLVVDDADGYCAQVTAAGGEVTKSLRTEPWGMREFGLRTVDGHRVMAGSPVADPA